MDAVGRCRNMSCLAWKEAPNRRRRRAQPKCNRVSRNKFPATPRRRPRLQAYTDKSGEVHPIRNSPGYDSSRTTDGRRRRRKGETMNRNPRPGRKKQRMRKLWKKVEKTEVKRGLDPVAARRAANAVVAGLAMNPKKKRRPVRLRVTRLEQNPKPSAALATLKALKQLKSAHGWQQIIHRAGAKQKGAGRFQFPDGSIMFVHNLGCQTQFAVL